MYKERFHPPCTWFILFYGIWFHCHFYLKYKYLFWYFCYINGLILYLTLSLLLIIKHYIKFGFAPIGLCHVVLLTQSVSDLTWTEAWVNLLDSHMWLLIPEASPASIWTVCASWTKIGRNWLEVLTTAIRWNILKPFLLLVAHIGGFDLSYNVWVNNASPFTYGVYFQTFI